jgi:hypothetical protein
LKRRFSQDLGNAPFTLRQLSKHVLMTIHIRKVSSALSKYRPEFPNRFGRIQDSRAFSQGFFHWYSEEHRHSELGLLTSSMVQWSTTIKPRSSSNSAKPFSSAKLPLAVPSEVCEALGVDTIGDVHTYGRLCVLVTPKPARKNATGLELIEQ